MARTLFAARDRLAGGAARIAGRLLRRAGVRQEAGLQ